MSIPDQIINILRSRKFWVLIMALAAIGAGYSAGTVDAWQAVQAVIAAGAAYSLGTAIEDAGQGSRIK